MKTVEFYSAEQTLRMKKRTDLIRIVTAAFALAAFACCLYLLITVKTLTAARNEFYACVISAAAGVIVIAVILNVITYRRRLLQHDRGVLKGTREETRFSGALEVGQKAEQIPGSISVKKVFANTEEGSRRFYIKSAEAARLAEVGKNGGTLISVNGFVFAVTHGEEAAQ
ncbi:MAG: hypothetical protein IK104_02780 [Clostridia bacterium]|nr:hypothetical protein [Clostridia bacterium]